MQTQERNNLIDLLRFIAAILVTVFHFYAIPNSEVQNWYKTAISYGHIGVPIFFIISGYCILITLKHSKAPTQFITRRFFRIFPPYWFSLLLTASVILFFKLVDGINSLAVIPKSPNEILATLVLLTKPITNVENMNWVYWTLPYEVFFYIIIYLCSYFKGFWFTVSLILVSALTCLLPVSYYGFLSYLRFWPFFCLGASLFKILNGPRDEKLPDIVLMISSIMGFYFIHESILYCTVSAIVILLAIYNHVKPLKQNGLSKLGELSYSIYLIHVPVGIYCFGRFRRDLPLQFIGLFNFVFDMLLIIFIIYLSRLMYRYIEIPFIRMGKTRYNRRLLCNYIGGSWSLEKFIRMFF